MGLSSKLPELGGRRWAFESGRVSPARGRWLPPAAPCINAWLDSEGVLPALSSSTMPQVFISYGAQSNGSLLQFYAFTEPNNPNDVYAFQASIGGQQLQVGARFPRHASGYSPTTVCCMAVATGAAGPLGVCCCLNAYLVAARVGMHNSLLPCHVPCRPHRAADGEH